MLCHAQAPGNKEDPVAIFRIQALRVLVPVLVLDKAGNPIDGLTLDDFQVMDEGKRHNISSLTVLKDERARGEEPGKDPAPTEQHDQAQ